MEDFNSYSLRYKEWLEDTVDESEVLPEDRAEVYYLEARKRSIWRRLLGLPGVLVWDDYFDDLNDARSWINEAADSGYIITIEAKPLR